MAKKKMNPLDKVAKRFNITTREVRDIVTAVSTLGRTVTDKNVRNYPDMNITKRGKDIKYKSGRPEKTYDMKELRSKAARNVAKQIGEVYTAATKGKSGTKSAKIKTIRTKAGNLENFKYATETKRKQGRKK